MTRSQPVVLAGPPFESPHPRVTVVHHLGCLNAGDGRQSRYVIRYVVDCRTRLLVDASTAAGAAGRAATIVRRREPRAVWLLDVDRSIDASGRATRPWRVLARAASDVQAAFVAWQPPDAGESANAGTDPAT